MSLYEPLARAAASALLPLRDALSSADAMQRLLAKLGLETRVPDALLTQIRGSLSFVEALDQLPGLLDALDRESNRARAIADLAEMTGQVVRGINDLAAIDAKAFGADAGPLMRPQTWQDLAVALPDVLLAAYLAQQAPALLAILRLVGVCVVQNVGFGSRDRFNWDQLGTLLSDPAGAARTTTGWGGDSFRAWWLQRNVGLALAQLGAPVEIRPRRLAVEQALTGTESAEPTGLESTVSVYEATSVSGPSVSVGAVFAASPLAGGTIFVGNHSAGQISGEVSISDRWFLTASGAVDGTATIGMRISPDGSDLVGGDAALGASMTLTANITDPWILVGDVNAIRFELTDLRVEFGIAGTTGAPEAYALASVDDGGFRLVLDFAGADSFLRGVIGDGPTITGGGELRWGSRSGLTFGGGAGFSITLVLDKQIGPINVYSLTIDLGASTTGMSLRGIVSGGIAVGPLLATIENVGAELVLTAGASDELSGLAAELRFVPPTGLGLGVDLEGIITGGGYLSIEDGRYAGVAALQMFGVGLTVIGIIETELPEDPNGWSMFLSVIADFTPVPLGFGFFLSGIGGFMGLHRTLDEIALAEGVRDGRIDSLLFPEDPLADAIRIISDIEAYFPTQQNTHAFGAMARIDWGVPALISAELGVVLVVPDFRVAVIGEIESILPTPDAPLIELHMGVVGYIDPAEATFWVTASIYDSRLVQYALSGDMAMYASLGEQPYFLLSVGGFHPDWTPPNYLPSTMRDLRRMTAAIDLGADLQVGLDAYFAITPNTLQFGAEVFVIAQMKKLGVDFSAKGDFGFDVLVIFTPFSISADMDANVMIEAEGAPLVSARVVVHLEGPEPWFGRATATFEFLRQPIDFDVAFGGKIKDDAPDAVELWDKLEEALRLPEGWSTPSIAASVTADTTLRPLDELVETGLWLAPDGALELRQRVLPLNREIEIFGAYVPDGESRFDIEAAGLATDIEAEWDSVEDWFAPAQFIEMGPQERLSAPSFEEMDAGMSLSMSGFAAPTSREDVTSVDLEYEELVLEDKTRKLGRRTLPIERFGLGPRFTRIRPGGPASRHTVSNLPSFRVKFTRYDVADPYDASRIVRGGIYADAVVARRTTSSAKSRARIMPTTTISEKVV